MNKLKAFATFLLSALGIFGANEYYKPKNVKDLLKWRGVKLASGDRVWKSMFFEYQEELKDLKIDNDDELWSWCSERFKQKNLNDEEEISLTQRYCSDNATSIFGRIIREGEDLKVIDEKDKDAFSINFVLTGRDPEVLKLINFEEKSKPSLSEISEKLSKWCEEQKRVNISGKEDADKISNFKKRCYNRNVRTVSDLLTKLGRKPMNSTHKFKERFNNSNLKNAPKLMEDIKGILGKMKIKLTTDWQSRIMARLNSPDPYDNWSREIENIQRITSSDSVNLERHAWQHYKWWCEDKLKASLLEDEMYPVTFAVISHRCSEEESKN